MYEVTEEEETVKLTVKNVKSENQGNYYAQLVNEAVNYISKIVNRFNFAAHIIFIL